MLPRHARCFLLSTLQRTQPFVKLLLLQDWQNRESFLQRPRTPLISFTTVQLRILCAARSLTTLCLFTIFVPGLGKLFGFWGFMVFRHAPIFRKGWGNNNNALPSFFFCLHKFSFCFCRNCSINQLHWHYKLPALTVVKIF